MRFKPKAFALMLIACSALAALAAWVTGLNFWVLAAIVVAAVLVNGLVASIEDKDSEAR